MRKFNQHIVLLFLLISSSSFACLNGLEYQLSTGTTVYIDHDNAVPYGHEFWVNEPATEIRKLDSLYQVKPHVDYLNEKGLVYIISKDYQKAIDLYLEIEKKTPGLYATASNLGTAYELLGDNVNALKWIEKAIEINPNSHHHSEWIHVNILKIKLGQMPLSSTNLIGVDFGKEDRPVTKLSPKALEELSEQLYFQLNERRSFVGPKDEIVAQLLFDYGNLMLLRNLNQEAKEVYETAIKYGFDPSFVNLRMAQLKDSNEQNEASLFTKIKNNWDTILISILSMITFLLIYGRKERKKRNR